MTPRRRGRLLRAVTAVASLLSAAAVAHAQDEGPIVIGRQEKLPPFALAMPHGSLDLLGQYSSDKVESDLSGTSKSNETLFEEALTLETTGHIVHPNLADLRLKGTFGLAQSQFDGTDLEDQTSSTIYLWDAQANIFREQRISNMVYTSRSDQLVDRNFGPSLREVYTTYGDLLQIRSQSVPTTFRIYRTEQEQLDLSGDDDFKFSENVFEWHTDSQPTPHQFVTWDYRVIQSEQSAATGPDNSSVGQSASLGHSIGFGPEYRYSLGSSLSYSDASGSYGSEQLRWDEILHINHTKNFESEYEYLLDSQTTGGVEQTYQRGTADFRHRLYQSLVSHAKLGYLQLDFSDGSATKDWFANSDFTYTKKVPYGMLLGTMAAGYDLRTTSGGSDDVPVLGQPITFGPDLQPVIVPGVTIIPSSIVLRDSTGRQFIEGIDYTVSTRPDGVQIDRALGGAIDANAPILLDYTAGPQPEAELSTVQFSLGMRYDISRGFLKGLSPYARFGLVEQSVEGGGGLIVPDSVRDYVGGVEYRFLDVTLTAEREMYQSKVIPFDATRLSARWDHRISTETVLTLRSSYSKIDYTRQQETTTDIISGITIEHRLTRELFVSGSADWVHSDDSIGGTTQGTQELLEIRWKRRQLEMYARARNSNLEGERSSTDFQLFQVGISRKF